jgi:uncharacterized membrane protein
MSNIGLWRWLAFGAWLGLFVWLLLWIVWLYPPLPEHRSGLLLLALGPLVWFSRGVIAASPRSHAAVSVLSTLYLCHGTFELAVAVVPLWLAAVETLLATLLLVSSAWFARVKARAMRAQAAIASD